MAPQRTLISWLVSISIEQMALRGDAALAHYSGFSVAQLAEWWAW